MDICDAINVSEEGYVVQLIGLLCLVQSLLSNYKVSVMMLPIYLLVFNSIIYHTIGVISCYY